MDSTCEPETRVDSVSFFDAGFAIGLWFETVGAFENVQSTSRARAVGPARARDRKPRLTRHLEEGHFAGLDFETSFRGKKTDLASHGLRV